jgi:FtsP/CotA-like multicopper oxidase with cupredoxin domain
MLSSSVVSLLGFASLSFAAQVKFQLNVTWAQSSLVGTPKKQFLLNGQSPGPPLDITVGDSVEFEVVNSSPYNTTVHFHGITQVGTVSHFPRKDQSNTDFIQPWSDGVPGVSQYPILPGQNFTYKWTADEYGQYWYHSHFKGQIMDGFYGPITIQPSKSEPRPFGLISNDSSDVAAMTKAEGSPSVLMVSDWMLENYDTLIAAEAASGYDIACPDAILLNGKGSVNCLGEAYYATLVTPKLLTLLNGSLITAKGCVPPLPALEGRFPSTPSALPPSAYDVCTATNGQVEVISVDASAGWASINMVSAAGVDTLEVSIDNHTMFVYATDGAYIVPQPVNAVVIPNGNRYQAMIKLDQTPGNYSIRVASVANNQFATGYGVLSYTGATEQVESFAAITYAGANSTATFRPFSDAKIVPFTPVAVGDASSTFFMSVQQLGASYLWTLSGHENYNLTTNEEVVPLLFDPTQSLANDNNLVIKTKNNTWVDLVLINPGPLAPAHPIHKHSNKGYIIGTGIGAFNFSSVAAAAAVIPQNFNFVSPPPRDGFTVPPATGNATWMAVRYEVVNPGAFIMHCHIQTHLSGGMAMVMLDGVDAFPTVPKAYLNAASSSTSTKTPVSPTTTPGSSTAYNSASPAGASATATGHAVANKPMIAMLGGAMALAALV